MDKLVTEIYDGSSVKAEEEVSWTLIHGNGRDEHFTKLLKQKSLKNK